MSPVLCSSPKGENQLRRASKQQSFVLCFARTEILRYQKFQLGSRGVTHDTSARCSEAECRQRWFFQRKRRKHGSRESRRKESVRTATSEWTARMDGAKWTLCVLRWRSSYVMDEYRAEDARGKRERIWKSERRNGWIWRIGGLEEKEKLVDIV